MKYKNLAFCFIVFMLVIMSYGCKKDDSADVATQPEHACADITTANIGKSNVQITSSTLVTNDTSYPNQPYCKVLGKVNERVSAVDGKTYAISFEMRLPSAWNNRFLYQANGGNDGSVVAATGPAATGGTDGLKRGFAVLSTDAGHIGSDPVNTPTWGLASGNAFGLDPQARYDYGYMATGTMAPIAKDIISYYYAKSPLYSYMTGCSNGGRHGMVAASRYPDFFDGILVGDPGFNLPKSAVQHAWDVQSFIIANADFRDAFADADLDSVEDVILTACDSLDGVADGMVNELAKCQTLFNLATSGAALTANQITALSQSMGGPKNAANEQLYSDWPYDPGIAYPGWKSWKFRSTVPPWSNYPIIAVMGAGSLLYTFSTPPPLLTDPIMDTVAELVNYLTTYSFETDAPKIFATNATFTQSAMQYMPPTDVNNPTMADFRSAGGKMLIYHGQADPVFSVNDTINWYEVLAANYGGNPTDFVRLFLIPGMNHCSGGCATDQFNALSALMAWVEKGDAPDQIYAWVNAASADITATGWSTTRTRPLCVYPKIARYVSGSVDLAASFECSDPTP